MNDKKAFFVLRAIELYNKFRAPEAEARLLDLEGNVLVIEFRGPFCETCGVRDWVEDLAYVIKSMGGDAELVEYIEPGDNANRRVGVFELKKVPEKVE